VVNYKTIKSNNTKQVFWVAIGGLFTFGFSIISSMILSRYLSKNDYGTYKQIIYIYTMLLVVFAGGLPNIYSYFLSHYPIQQGAQIVKKISRLLLVSGFIFSLTLFILSDSIGILLNNHALADGLKYFSIVPLLFLPTLGIDGILASYQKTAQLAIFNILSRLLMLIFMICPIIFLSAKYEYVIWGWVIASFFVLIIAEIFKNKPFKQIQKNNTLLTYKEIFKYAFPLFGASIAGIMISSSDQFFISRFFGTKIFAEFSNGFIQLPFVMMVTSSSATVLMPLFSKMIYKESSITDIVRILKSTILKSALIIYPLVIFAIINAKHIIIIMYSEKYKDSAIYFQIALIVNFFNIIVFAPIIMAIGKTKFYMIVHLLIALFVWIFGYINVLIFNNPVSVAIFSVIVTICKIGIFLLFIATYFQQKKFSFIPIKQLITIVFHSLLIILIINYGCMLLCGFNFNSFFIIVTFPVYIIALFITQKYFNLNYLSVLKPLLKNNN